MRVASNMDIESKEMTHTPGEKGEARFCPDEFSTDNKVDPPRGPVEPLVRLMARPEAGLPALTKGFRLLFVDDDDVGCVNGVVSRDLPVRRVVLFSDARWKRNSCSPAVGALCIRGLDIG